MAPRLTDRLKAHLQGMSLNQRELANSEQAFEASLVQTLEQAAEHYSALNSVRLPQPASNEVVETDYQAVVVSAYRKKYRPFYMG